MVLGRALIGTPFLPGGSVQRNQKQKQEKEQAKAIKTLRINETQTRIRELFFRLQNARRIMELYGKELLPQAAKSMEIAETWFRQGESSFSDFIETQAVWYNFQLAYTRARADYGIYLARLEGHFSGLDDTKIL